MARQSRLGRLAALGGLTSRVTGSYIGQRLRAAISGESGGDAGARAMIDNAERVVATLSQLKGAAMKVGQSVALAAQHLDLPDDVQALLGTLHAEAVPVPFATIKATVERELEAPLDDVFASFDPDPLGTASLAQAHAARLRPERGGGAVVVKVLHDGVEDSVDTDLMAVRALLSSTRAFGRDKAEQDAIFNELCARLTEELDYLQEAVNIQAFVQFFGDDPRVRIPRHHPSLCTERVLVMDRLPGKPMRRFLETATPEVRQRAGMHLAELFFEMAFRHRMLHCDPHPGNYLFEPDGRVDLLDFGCVKRFDPYWIATYARCAVASLDGDREALLAAVRDLGAWKGNSPGAADTIWNFCDLIVGPLRDGPYLIGGKDDSILDRVHPVARGILDYPEIVGPPDIIFLHRTLGGLYTLARQLQVEADWRPLIRKYAAEAIANAS